MLKHVCDVCGRTRELDGSESTIVKDYTGEPVGTLLSTCPRDWLVIQLLLPLSESQRGELRKKDRRSRSGLLILPGSWTKAVCSLACGKKALDEAREYLGRAFEELEQRATL